MLIPLAGITLRSFVETWGEGISLAEVLTLDHYRELLDYPNVVRSMVNTLGIGLIGGAAAVAFYTAIALAIHRWPSGWTQLVDYLVMLPRAMPGLVAGLALLWVFLFFKPLTPLRETLVSVWVAYTIVWLAYGMRLVSGTLLQVAPELEEAARSIGATDIRAKFDVTLPLIRTGMLASWLLIFLIFVREYSTGIYLLGPGTEVIGSLLVSLWGTGAIDLVSALSVVNVAMIGAGLIIAAPARGAPAWLSLRSPTLRCGMANSEILKGVSVTVPAGKVVALLGPSGSGKTTLLRAVAGLETPYRGSIRIGDNVAL